MKKTNLFIPVVMLMMIGSVNLYSKCASGTKIEKKELKESVGVPNKDLNVTAEEKKIDPSLKSKIEKSTKCGIGKCG